MAFPKGGKHTAATKAKMSASQKGQNSLQAKHWVITYPDGKKTRIRNLNRFCQDNGLKQANMTKVADGICTHHKGFGVKRCEE